MNTSAWRRALGALAIAALAGGALGVVLSLVAQRRIASPVAGPAEAFAQAMAWAFALGATALLGGLAVALFGRRASMRAMSIAAAVAGLAAAGGALGLAAATIAPRSPLAAIPRAAAPGVATPDRDIDRPNVVLFTVDTLRSDRLGAWGAERPTSPAIDEFAAGGTLFEAAIAQAPATKRSMASLLTGLLPHTFDEAHAPGRPYVPATIPTLARHLAAAGYATAGFTSNPYLVDGEGFAQAFDHFDASIAMYGSTSCGRACSVDDLVGPALAWAAEAPTPYFLWVHVMDPHHPYEPNAPGPWEPVDDPDWQRLRDIWAARSVDEVTTHMNDLARGRVGWAPGELDFLLGRYDAEILQTDAGFARLRAGLEAQGRSDADTLTVLASDHGEEFLEHGLLLHSYTLFDEVLRVPLAMRGPGVPAGVRVPGQVANLDVLPTVLELAGLAPPPLDGTSLVPWMRDPTRPSRPILAQRADKYASLRTPDEKLIVRYRPYPDATFDWRPWRALPAMARTLFEGARRDKVGYWRLDADPTEQRDVVSSQREAARSAYAAFEAQRALHPPRDVPDTPAPLRDVDPTTRESLRALGYAE